MGTDEERQDDKERISISIHLTHLKLLNREQDLFYNFQHF